MKKRIDRFFNIILLILHTIEAGVALFLIGLSRSHISLEDSKEWIELIFFSLGIIATLVGFLVYKIYKEVYV